MGRKNFYIVTKGRKTGLYKTWDGDGGAKVQIQKFPGAVYKGFSSYDEAVLWLNLVGCEDGLKIQLKKYSQKRGDVGVSHKRDLTKGNIVIFTDGACRGNPGPGGYGVALFQGKHRKEFSGGFEKTTNNRMELMACIVGLRSLRGTCDVIVYSDSKYVVDCVKKGWAARWQANHWMRNKKEAAENVDLWKEMLSLCDNHTVEFRWVKGHAGIEENEVCDRLSTEAARGNRLEVDKGFTQGQNLSLFE